MKQQFLSDPIVLLIILVAIGNLVLYVIALLNASRLLDELAPRNRKANPRRKAKEKTADDSDFEDTMFRKIQRLNSLYSVYANVTALFPLLGMLGTVLSLLRLSGAMEQSDLAMGQFFSALNTTLAGLCAAIVFKFMDSFLSVRIERNNKEYDTLTDRNSRQREARNHEDA